MGNRIIRAVVMSQKIETVQYNAAVAIIGAVRETNVEKRHI